MLYPTGGLLPEFAASATNIAQPTSNKRSSGWATNEAPASSYINWLHRTTYDWMKYLAYEKVLVEDFIRPNPERGSAVRWTAHAFTGVGPQFANGPWTFLDNSIAQIVSTGGGTGFIETELPANYTDSFFNTLVNPVRVSMIVDVLRVFNAGNYGGGSGSMQAFGIRDSAEFMRTGSTGLWYFQWKPTSSVGPTAIPLGATRMKGRFEWDHQQPTMTVTWWPLGSVNTPTSFTVGPLYLSYEGNNNDILGARTWTASGEYNYTEIDRVEVAIKRGTRGI